MCVRAIHTPQRCARADRVHFGRYGERYMVQYRPHGARAEPGLSHLVRRAAARVVHSRAALSHTPLGLHDSRYCAMLGGEMPINRQNRLPPTSTRRLSYANLVSAHLISNAQLRLAAVVVACAYCALLKARNAEHRPGTAAPKNHPMLRLRLIAPPHGIGYLSQRHLGAVARSVTAANTLIRPLARCSNR